MKERPILFSGPMVNAIREERKTQTRRVVKPQPELESNEWHYEKSRGLSVDHYYWKDGSPANDKLVAEQCPYGVPGDRLWVREAWAKSSCDRGSGVIRYAADDTARFVVAEDGGEGDWCGLAGVADASRCLPVDRWRPSIHMPRWACRLVLEVVSVRVERLQAISEADAIAEGFDASTCAAVLDAAAGKGMDPQGACYVSYNYDTTKETESEGWHCRECAKKLLKTPEDCVCSSGRVAPECDGPASCDDCGVPLLISLTEYGTDRELFMDDDRQSNVKFYAASGADAAIKGMVAGGIGDLRDRHLPRLAQIGFATAIDLFNGTGTWAENPWAWVVGFRKVPA